MKTLLITLEYAPFKGGVANYYSHLAHYWPLGEQFHVLDNARQELLRRGTGFSLWPAWGRALGVIRRKLRSGKFDYLLVGQILPLGTVAFLLSLVRPLRYGVFLHGMDLSLAHRAPRKRWLSALILKRADRIICANSYVARLTMKLFSGLDEDKIVVINPGIVSGAPYTTPEKLAALRQEYGLTDKLVLLSVGRLVRRKGVDQTLLALSLLSAEERDKVVYVVAGTGPDELSLKQLITPDIKDKVVFLGEVSEEEKWLWLQACDIFIMPARQIGSDFEGFGIVYLEANICQKPVIAGRSGGVSDAVSDGESGLLVDPDSPESISRAISRLVSSASERERLGRIGKERALSDFAWEKQAQKLLEIIS